MPRKKKNYIKKKISSYDPKITLKKFFTGLGMTIVPIIIGYTLNFLETEEFPPEYAGYIVIATAFLHALMNYFKHRNDTKEIEIPTTS
ncbi:MAG: hypothetical protein DRN07_05660 [Thermoplasmata archaeon]|nr:MAG: hypothetical protein DRN07_05660 [Thermoplasmata archaeon]